jgi:hypothetical protein
MAEKRKLHKNTSPCKTLLQFMHFYFKQPVIYINLTLPASGRMYYHDGLTLNTIAMSRSSGIFVSL